jgi:hypothetical protein
MLLSVWADIWLSRRMIVVLSNTKSPVSFNRSACWGICVWYTITCHEESSFLMLEKVKRIFAYLLIGTNFHTDIKYKNLCNYFQIKFPCITHQPQKIKLRFQANIENATYKTQLFYLAMWSTIAGDDLVLYSGRNWIQFGLTVTSVSFLRASIWLSGLKSELL